MIFIHKLPLRNALKPCFSGRKNKGFTLQKMVFGIPKAMLLQLKTYVFGFSTLSFDQINESFSLDEESGL